MRRLLSALIVALAVAGVLSARSGAQPPASPDAAPTPAPKDTLLVDLTADEVYPYEVGDSTVMCLVGNFAAHHNGAVITCDSAVRYNDMLIECFGHVLINKNTTYVYGDRADYNGLQNEARVYSELVKVVDGDATLYTRRFLFNTLDNVGKFGNGGVVVKGENLLESDRGYYYANRREVAASSASKCATKPTSSRGIRSFTTCKPTTPTFSTTPTSGNQQGDYLYADRGEYEKPDELYSLTRNGYVLTDKQELWSDSLDYYRATGHLVLRRNIQIDDTEHKSLAFGDYGEYWKEPVRALLTPPAGRGELRSATGRLALHAGRHDLGADRLSLCGCGHAAFGLASHAGGYHGGRSTRRRGFAPGGRLDPPALTAADSMYRMVKAYRDVRMFRSDFQAVCDSLVAFSSDSTIHLYIDPVLWNETNQVTSDVMDVFTEHEQIERVEFVGRPMMITELDTMYYNQVTGKEMTAFFRNNQIFRNDVNGNVQTIYYLQEDDSPRVVNLLVVEGGSMTSYIEQRKVDKIVYRANPVATIYPLDKIPEDQNLFLKDFKWEAERRPTQRDVFDRRIRPSLRDQKTALRKPESRFSSASRTSADA